MSKSHRSLSLNNLPAPENMKKCPVTSAFLISDSFDTVMAQILELMTWGLKLGEKLDHISFPGQTFSRKQAPTEEKISH